MQELFNLGISEKTLKKMIELSPDILELTENEIKEKKDLLKSIKCNDAEVLNIISSNPLMLNKANLEIIKLINYLIQTGFKVLNILFDSNPYILNLEPFEIENYINKRIAKGELLEDIINDLDSNPYLFNDI